MKLVGSTNRLTYPNFTQNSWQGEHLHADGVCERFIDLGQSFSKRVLELRVGGTAVVAGHPVDFAIDPTRAYAVGFIGIGGTADLLLSCNNLLGSDNATLTIPITFPATYAGMPNEIVTVINPQGGAAPAWPVHPSGGWPTFALRLRIRNPQVPSTKYVCAAYVIPLDELTHTATTRVRNSNTHEGMFAQSSQSLFAVNFGYNQVAKFLIDGARLRRTGIANCDDYPHDICEGDNNDFYLVTVIGASLQRFDQTTLSLLNTWPILGGRQALGIANDGNGSLYIGAGIGAGQPAIIKFDIATATQTLLSTDVEGGTANLPAIPLGGDVWSYKNQNPCEVKRISAAGVTLATIGVDLGFIYGMGTDGNLVYASGTKGVVAVDPATNAIAFNCPFRTISMQSSNIRPDANGKMWGTSGNGIYCLDPVTRVLEELPHKVGAKWACAVPDGVAVGYGALPTIEIYQ